MSIEDCIALFKETHGFTPYMVTSAILLAWQEKKISRSEAIQLIAESRTRKDEPPCSSPSA
jgi:hypothetical protein